MRPTVYRSLAQSASSLSQRRLVRVQLLADKPGLGNAGQICLVQPGRMRNELLPRQQAVYLPLPTPTTRSREALLAKEVEQEATQAAQEISNAEAREQIKRELGAIQLLSLRRNLEAIPSVSYSRHTTTPSTVPADQLPEPALTIQGSISVNDVVQNITEQHSAFSLETQVAEPGQTFPIKQLTAQQISTTCDFKLVPADGNIEADAIDRAGKIKKTGKYNLQVTILPLDVKVNVPVFVHASVPVSSAATTTTPTSAASPSTMPNPTSTSTPASVSGVRAFSTSASTSASSGPRPTTMETAMRTKLTEAFAPAELHIRNDSSKHAHHAAMAAQGGGNGETHFFIEIVSDRFEGMPQIKRHRAVNALMAEEFERGLHALSLRTRTTAERDRANVRTDTQTTSKSPSTLPDGTACPTPSSSATEPNPPLTTTQPPSLAPRSSTLHTSPAPGQTTPLDPQSRRDTYFRRVAAKEDAPPAWWQRTAKLAGGLGGLAATFYLVAMADFGEGEHCFSPIRRVVFGDARGYRPFEERTPWKLRD